MVIISVHSSHDIHIFCLIYVVEDELKRLQDRVTKLTAENIELQSTVDRGDFRHNAVNHQLQLLQKSEEQVIKEFKQLKSERVNLFEVIKGLSICVEFNLCAVIMYA